ncbi:hypothetical protein K9N68_14780 [Kovacikia minuta CCNUW1]|uniref:hypothetical protein n=1 Tax=Kovacikia minuta TaxID=2931930 RepID=UPI001CCB2F41|nr:hypothetical protein [Kovacikia minuta]UBF28986.1 hypothetical protein K9N68_14780 [Kovacikia minuta CCNUW1]
MQLAQEVGVGDRLHLLPAAPPDEMVRLAACHDIGLSLELTEPFNRAICLTNKIFAYLLAGVPVLLSKTPAQAELSRQLGKAAVLVDIAEPAAIAAVLDHWFADPAKLADRRQAAWHLGQTQYNWDVEQKRFLKVVEKTLQ